MADYEVCFLIPWRGSCGEVSTFSVRVRLSITQTLASLNPTGRPPSDQDMLRWAQTTVQKSTSPNKPNPPTQAIRSFKDPSIANALFFLDLLDALRPGIVDYSMVVKPANDYDEKRQNGEHRHASDARAATDQIIFFIQPNSPSPSRVK